MSTEEGFSIWVAERGGVARRIHEHEEPVRLAGGWGLTERSTGRAVRRRELAVLEVMEDGDVLHPSLRSIDAVTGATVADLRDAGLELTGFGFSPVPGDTRIAITHERNGEQRPATWDARSGELDGPPVDLAGPVEPIDWWPDGSALLLLQLVDGRHRLHRYDLGTGTVTALDTEAGSITAAAVRPDGEVWYRVHNGEHPATILAVRSTTPLLEAEGPRHPRAGPSRRGGSRTPTASGSTGSSSARRATARTR